MLNSTIKRLALLAMHLGLIGFAVGAILFSTEWTNANRARLEAWWNPVVVDWKFSDWHKDENGYWSVAVEGRKVRAECIYIADQSPSALVVTGLSPAGKEVPLLFPDDDTPGSNRPPGYQSFGRWMPETRVLEPGDKVTFASKHQCHPGTPVVTVTGPVTVGKNWP